MANLHTKLDAKSHKCIFVGYSVPSKAYKSYNLVSGQFFVSRYVKFNEAEKWVLGVNLYKRWKNWDRVY